MTWIAGVDGFKSSWFVILQNVETGELRPRLCPCFIDLATLPEQPLIVAVDIPIGLPDFTKKGGRFCEQQARRLLGPRVSSVFSAVGRRALDAALRVDAHRMSLEAGGLGIGAQAWGLAKKLREVDAFMTPDRQRIIREVHPEVSFWAMNGGAPMPFYKKTAEGVRDRMHTLVANGFENEFITHWPRTPRVGRDDFLDACAALWTAKRIFEGNAQRLPEAEDR